MIKQIIDAMSEVATMPVEVSEVVNLVIELGYQDRIYIHPEACETGKIWGAYVQFRENSVPYAAPDFVSYVIYNSNIAPEWQRVVCCKELVHICDKEISKANTREKVSGLFEKLLEPPSTKDFNLSSYLAVEDILAIFPALGILFPEAARLQALSAVEDKSRSVAEIADWACLPIPLVQFCLKPEWPELLAKVVDRA